MKLRNSNHRLVIADSDYRDWIEHIEQPRLQAELKNIDRQFAAPAPTISVLLPTYNSDIAFLTKAIDSVIGQIYPHWQLCIVDDASAGAAVKSLLQRYAAQEPRISVQFLAENRGIAGATNAALLLATGDYCALLDHDDVLSPHALLRIAQYAQENPEARLLYSDSDRLDTAGQRVEPFLKPEWNYDLFLGQNYLNHLTVYKTALLRTIGGLREGFEGSQDYELALRAIERIPASAIVHVPDILYHWRKVDTSFSGSQLGKAVQAAHRAIAAHFQRQGVSAQVKACPGALLYNRIVWPQAAESVAIMVYSADTKSATASLTAWRQTNTSSGIGWDCCRITAANAADTLNRWVEKQEAAVIGFIAAGFTPPSPQVWTTWLAHSARSGMGAVGAKYVTSSGVVLGHLQMAPDPGQEARLAGCVQDVDNSGYFASLFLDRQVPALQAGCLLVQRDAFLAAGGWSGDPLHSIAAGTDLSRRLRALGKNLLWHAAAAMQSTSSALDASLLRENGESTVPC